MELDEVVEEGVRDLWSAEGMMQRMKWAYLENWSTTTRIMSAPSERGSPSMKSMVTLPQMRAGIGSS